MGENSNIEWCDHTFNPWIGCTKVSAGCKHCYAETLMAKRVCTSETNWKKPLAWNRKAEKEGRRYRVFCASLADVFEDKLDQPELHKWRFDLFDLICKTPNLDWLLLTKRPESVLHLVEIVSARHSGTISSKIAQEMATQWLRGTPPKNIWIGTSVENQEQADKRIPELLKIPAKVRFLSMEPLLGAVDLSEWIGEMDCGLCRVRFFGDACPKCGESDGGGSGQIGFAENAVVPRVIVSGESGRNARPMHPDWVRSIRDQCVAAGVPFHFKQWGEYAPNCCCDKPKPCQIQKRPGTDWGVMFRCGKKAAGNLLDGRQWLQFPDEVQS